MSDYLTDSGPGSLWTEAWHNRSLLFQHRYKTRSMGRNDNDKSFLGKLSRFQGKLEDGVNRRMEHNDQPKQPELDDSMEKMHVNSDAVSQTLYHNNFTQSFPHENTKYTANQNLQYSSQPLHQTSYVPNRSSRQSIGREVTPTFASSSQSEPPSYFTTSFASLSLHMTDRIRLLDFPQEIVDLVRNVLQRNWQRGIQQECVYYGSYEFKLYGRPWSISMDVQQAIDARRLIRHLFAALYDVGWILALSTDVSRKQADKDTLIFRHQTPAPAKCEWMSIDFARGDRIRIMDAPQSVLDAVNTQLQPAIQEHVRPKVIGMWELKLHGYPWRAVGGETMNARRTLLQLFMVLERFGFTVYASIDQESTTQDNSSEADTWHCLRPIGWAPGAPVYHG